MNEMKKDYEYLAKNLKLLEEKNKTLEKQQLEMTKKVDEMETRVLEECSEWRVRHREDRPRLRHSMDTTITEKACINTD